MVRGELAPRRHRPESEKAGSCQVPFFLYSQSEAYRDPTSITAGLPCRIRPSLRFTPLPGSGRPIGFMQRTNANTSRSCVQYLTSLIVKFQPNHSLPEVSGRKLLIPLYTPTRFRLQSLVDLALHSTLTF